MWKLIVGPIIDPMPMLVATREDYHAKVRIVYSYYRERSGSTRNLSTVHVWMANNKVYIGESPIVEVERQEKQQPTTGIYTKY
jgi:hypothetical protein